ncbi:TonB-dependent receptor [Paraferrimonas haliotis]|uniref:TonB-dependent receptor n=1 Tax=Paraferrimonas haliotis TaxID=2013866 RepID=A0AA37TR40_9GAMM|nr:TonB-dependent receptor [Paraferrimonas haliotis]GLS83851.1 TonB-dependent receptor [Paraferrimonas haliotis]GLS83978.1 TonB-dependent receptor [Paraferrimonas haliotis]
MTHQRTIIATAVSSALLLGANTNIAYAADETAQGDIERIEVTANRRVQSINEVPYNISAVAGSDLEDNNIVDSTEMLRNVAGITLVDRGYRNSGAVNGIVIRGVNVDSGSNGDIALSAVPTVASYVNDTPLFANFILKDIEQVEILRGPQGTLYGSGSLAGTVKYRMNRPVLGEFSGDISLGGGVTEGSDGYNKNGDLLFNIPLGDKVAFRANIGKIDNDGVVDYVNVYKLNDAGAPIAAGGDLAAGEPEFMSVKDADTVDITYGRASLLFQATDDLSFLASYQHQKDEIGGRRQVTRGTHWVDKDEDGNRIETPYGDYENGAVVLEPSEREVKLAALEIDWNLGFATLTSSSSQYEHSGQSISDNTGFYAKNDWFTDLYYGSPRPLAVADRGYEEKAFVQELRLVSNETKFNLDWVVGLYYMDQDTKSSQDSYMPGYQEWAGAAFTWWPTMGGFGMVYTDQDFLYRRVQNFKDMAAFGELTYHFSESFRVTGGIRGFKNEFVNDTEVSFPIWPFLGAEPSFKTDENGTLFKFNASFDITDDMMVYGTVAEGYRRGGANAVPLTGSLAERPEWQQYKSDSAINYELGLKGFLGDNNHSYTLSGFLIDWKDPQLNTASAWGFFTVANGESARTQGIEAELRGYLTDELKYNLGYAYVDAFLTADFYVPSAVWATDTYRLQAKDGDKLPSTPEHTLTAGLDYVHSFENGWDWITSVNGYYQSESLNYLGESDKLQAELDAFSIVNFNTRLSIDNWDVTVYVKNIFNEDGVTGTLPEGYMGTDPAENFYGNSSKDYISQPRTIGANVRYRF